MGELNRRQLLVAAGAVGVAALLPETSSAHQAGGFTLPPLPYPVNALEPHIDAKTMEIHHDRHHKAYVDNLNKALTGTEWFTKSIDEVIKAIPSMPSELQEAVTNNGGGHYNHSLFWKNLGKGGGKPSEDLLKAWGGGFDLMQKAVNEAGLKRFGSGWSWVMYEHTNKRLKVVSTANQDCPLTKDETPLFGVDVWEHAYYLKYLNKRADYLNAFWNVVNWDAVNARYADLVKA